MSEVIKDWRGTPITPGRLCIYGAPVGRSIALVEAEVVGFTKSGRVNLRIIRRAYGSSWSEREVVHVGADRLVIVDKLPDSDVPLTSTAIEARKAATTERKRILATHDFPEYVSGRWDGSTYHQGFQPGCTRCGSGYYNAKECGDA